MIILYVLTLYLLSSEKLDISMGKIDITSSVKQQTMTQIRMICQFDEFSQNRLLNPTLYKLKNARNP